MLIRANAIYSPKFDELTVKENCHISVEHGKVAAIYDDAPETREETLDFGDMIVIPSFTDLHLHAVQYANMGLGYDKELLPWLEKYTFPEEAKFSDTEYAEEVFEDLIRDLKLNGIFRSCVFSSLHLEAAKILAQKFEKAGLCAYIGKVNMDRNGSEALEESTAESVENTEIFVNANYSSSGRVRPIITPRFVPSCTDVLMDKLGMISEKFDLPVQSHLNENRDEIKWVSELCAKSENYLDAYDIHGLVRKGKTIMAHCVYNEPEEIEKMRESGVYAAHCPCSNSNLASGIMKVKEMVGKGIKVGLGSDIAGGETLSMFRIMTEAIKQSKLLSAFTEDRSHIISFINAFHMATRASSSFFGDAGTFEPGMSFDALVLDDSRLGSNRKLSLEERLQRIIYLGDDREIFARFFQGEEITV